MVAPALVTALETGAPDVVVLALGVGGAVAAGGEGEVDRAAVGVGVGEVRHDERQRRHRLAHRAIELEQLVPRGRDLHGVDEGAGVEHLLHAEADGVAVLEPAQPGPFAEIAPAGALELDGGRARLGLGQRALAFEADDQQAAVLRVGEQRRRQLVDQLGPRQRQGDGALLPLADDALSRGGEERQVGARAQTTRASRRPRDLFRRDGGTSRARRRAARTRA